jgi:hypothetical protein
MSFLSRLRLGRRPGRDAARRPLRTQARPRVEPLEDRTLPATRMVVPMSQPADNVNTFHDLTSAINAPTTINQDVIQIEPGSAPGSATVSKTLIIRDDPSFGPASSPQVPSLTMAASGSALVSLNVGAVTINNGTAALGILSSVVGSITQNVGSMGNGANIIAFNTINGPVVLGSAAGNPPAANDQVIGNAFVSSKPGILLHMTLDNNLTIRNNTFLDSAAGVTGIEVDDSNPAFLLNNNVLVPGAGSTGIVVDSATRTTFAVLRDNRIDTGGQGTGIATTKMAGSSLLVNLANNDLVRNLLGLKVTGDGTANADALGTIDAGGGPLGSVGGNNFHGYTGGGHAAIITANVLPTSDTVSARFNIFTTSAPNSVVTAGAGSIDTSSPLTPGEAYIDRLYDNFFGRSGTTGPGGELAFWAGQVNRVGARQVVHSLLFSPEGLARTVDRLVLAILNRESNATEEALLGNFLRRTGSLERLIALMLASPEFQARANALAASPSTPNANFVQGMFLVLFGRPASASDIATWTARLQTLSHSQLANAFVKEPEFRFLAVRQLYFADVSVPPVALAARLPNLLHRNLPPSQAEVAGWASSKLSLNSIIEQIASSPEFMANG